MWKPTIELEAKLTGEIEGDQVNVMVSLDTAPEWISLRTQLVAILKQYPDALEAVRNAID